MTDHIEPAIAPALSAEEWASLAVGVRENPTTHVSYHGADAAKTIAEANYRLPDSDPRKITRADVTDLRGWIADLTEYNSVADKNAGHLRKIADALESYLPPANDNA